MIITEKSLTLNLGARLFIIPRSDPRWDDIVSNIDNPEQLKRLLMPTADFAPGQVWRTRSGGRAVVQCVTRDAVTVEIDNLFELDLPGGRTFHDVDHDDDLMELVNE